MKRHTLFLVSLLALGSLCAQNPTKVTPELFEKNPDLAGGIYHTYHYEAAPQPKVPSGYAPFYISAVTRHASRWHTSPYRYVLIQDYLNEAARKGDLTEYGLHVQKVMDRIAGNAAGRNSEISPIGIEEQRGIAERMYSSFRSLFSKKGARVDSYSSDSHRCIMTMSVFDMRLTQLNPTLDIRQCCNGRVQQALREHRGCESIMKEAKAVTLARIGEVVDRIADGVLDRIYLPGRCPFRDDRAKKADFVRSLSDLAIIQQDTEEDRLDDMFTAQEKYDLWEQVNTYRYAQYGASLRWGDPVLGDGMLVLRMLLEDADAKLKGEGRIACLRFAHDYTVLSLIEALKVDGECVRTDDLDHLKDVWVDFDHAPMSSNIQFVFYRNRKNDVIVKIMHDEKAVTVPVRSDIAPFYRWEDLRKHIEGCIAEISAMPKVKALGFDDPKPMKSAGFGTIYSKYGN